MKVLMDTNVVLDVWGKTEDFEHSFIALDVALLNEFDICIAASMAPSIVYLLSARKLASRKEALAAFGMIMELADVIDVSQSDCREAYECDPRDFEDALIAYAAKRNGVDLIVTRNKRDFAEGPVPALSPREFVELFKPNGYEYEVVAF